MTTLAIFHPIATLTTERDFILNHDRLHDFLDARLKDYGFARARACLSLAVEKRGDSLRDDGHTPAILHEMTQAMYMFYLLEAVFPLPDPEAILCINFLHDLGEDYGMDREALRNELNARGHASPDDYERITDLGWRMTKKFMGRALFAANADYYESMLRSPETIIAKCLDRIHNLATLIGAKPRDEVQIYMDKTRDLYEPFLAAASHLYPQYDRTFHALRSLIRSQIELTRQLYIQPGPLHAVQTDFNSRSGFLVPEGLHPLHMIQNRTTTCLLPQTTPVKPVLEPQV